MNDNRSKIVNILIQRHLTITAAESLTAGEFQSSLGDIPGVSAVFFGGLVTYSNQAKHQILGVPEDLIKNYGVVSKEVATSMAYNAKRMFKTDIAVSFTGAAGPDPLEGHPAGTVWIGLSFPQQETQASLFCFKGDRNEVRKQCVSEAYHLLNQKLEL